MKRKGFTLIEALMGLCLLGLICVTILPIISSSSKLSNKNFEKVEMMCLGEMIIENLKAFKYDSGDTTNICNMELKEIVDLFKSEERSIVELDFPGKYENYNIRIEKNAKNSKLWEIFVSIDYNKEGGIKGVTYKALLPSK